MSVNVYDKSKVGTADELTPVATMGRNRVWTGTKAAAEAAMRNGDIGNGTVVYITDDYDDKTVIDTANYAVTAGVANKVSNDATNVAGDKVATSSNALFLGKKYVYNSTSAPVLDLNVIPYLSSDIAKGVAISNSPWGKNVVAPLSFSFYRLLISGRGEAGDINEIDFIICGKDEVVLPTIRSKIYFRAIKSGIGYGEWLSLINEKDICPFSGVTFSDFGLPAEGRVSRVSTFVETLANKGFKVGQNIGFGYYFAGQGKLTDGVSTTDSAASGSLTILKMRVENKGLSSENIDFVGLFTDYEGNTWTVKYRKYDDGAYEKLKRLS